MCDDVEHLVTEFFHQLFGIDRSNAIDQAAGKVAFDALEAARRSQFDQGGLELVAVLRVADPASGGQDVFSGVNIGQRADERHRFPAALDPGTQH